MELVVDNTVADAMEQEVELVVCGKFYELATDAHEAEFGFTKGQTVLTVGEGIFPISKEDPYLRRVYFAIVKFDGGTLDLQQKPIVVAAESLAFLSAETQEGFQAMLKAWEDTFQAPEGV